MHQNFQSWYYHTSYCNIPETSISYLSLSIHHINMNWNNYSSDELSSFNPLFTIINIVIHTKDELLMAHNFMVAGENTEFLKLWIFQLHFNYNGQLINVDIVYRNFIATLWIPCTERKCYLCPSTISPFCRLFCIKEKWLWGVVW